ncbi:PREDICTED: uncharacterized protein LOC108379869, partial [Rhagoletis zephyria]|uniref:uncharacterized protein LOC108379869 n=1 Tax=Rhagoletis zephyria TaxID=28612 RepID=UPI0008119C2E
ARYLNGFAVGLVVVPTLVLIGEEVDSSKRGMAAALLEMGSFTIGIFLQICCIFAYSNSGAIPSFQYKFGSTELHGIFVIGFAVITFLLSYFLVIESPVYYLLHNDENQAIDCLHRLQRPFVVTQETYQQLEEHKRYIQDNSFNSDLMLPALLKMCLYRGLVSLSFSPLIILALLLSTLSYAGDDTWPYILFGVFLWLGSFIGAFLMDYIGRKKLMIIGALICGSMAIGAGVVYNDVINFMYSTKMGNLLILLFVMELFAGVFSSSSSAYLTEAFPLHLKTYYIALSYTVQMFVLIIITSCSYDENSLGAYFITFGVFYVVACLLGLWCMPETRKLTLREARRKFAPVLYSWNE